MTNNSLSEDIYAVGQLMADNLNAVGVSDADVDDGLTTLANKILNASGGKTQTILTLNTPMVVYTDLFTVTGTLTDSEENPISGATIQLIWNDGTEHIATGTTNSSGVFSFTSTDPASVSSYSFQLFFAGDNDYNASNSSVVDVNTSKETSVLSITNPASGSSVSTDSVTVSGNLKDNDGTAMSGKSVSFSLNNVSAGTATVESDGSFSKTVTGLAAGSNSITVSFTATTTHTAASQSITVNRVTFDGLADLELIDGSQILSYADEQSTPGSQYATLEAQLTNGGSPAAISGVEIEFWDFTDDTSPVLLHSDYTEPDGTVSYTYESLGRGDVPIKAKVGNLLTKTFVVEDIYKYAPTEISKTSSSSSTAKVFPYNFALDSEHFEMEFDIKYPSPTWAVGLSPSTNSNFQYNIGLGINGDSPYYWRTWKPTSQTSNTGTDSNVISSTNTYVTAKFIYNNGDCSIYVNGSLIVNYNGLSSLYQGITKTVGLQSWGTGTFYLKNLKVRTL